MGRIKEDAHLGLSLPNSGIDLARSKVPPKLNQTIRVFLGVCEFRKGLSEIGYDKGRQ